MLFARPGKYKACGIFTIEHFILLIVTSLNIMFALKKTANISKKEVKKIIKNCTIIVWILEIVIILFKISVEGIQNVNSYLPLYYCSLLLYAGILSSFSKGKLKRTGDVFLTTGGIIGGIVFLLLPTTSLPTYPMLHIVSLHSFLFHGIMVYLGILINKTHYIELEKKDIKYYAVPVGIICVVAYAANHIFDSNFMFISKNFPGMPLEIIYNATGRFYTLIMIVVQMTLPFYTIYGINKLIKNRKRD